MGLATKASLVLNIIGTMVYKQEGHGRRAIKEPRRVPFAFQFTLYDRLHTEFLTIYTRVRFFGRIKTVGNGWLYSAQVFLVLVVDSLGHGSPPPTTCKFIARCDTGQDSGPYFVLRSTCVNRNLHVNVKMVFLSRWI